MGTFIEFRDRLVEAIKDEFQDDLYYVDWYDGLFDEEDLKEWGAQTPCAMVSVNTRNTSKHHSTGELLTDLKVTVVIIEHDGRQPRDADIKCWNLVERLGDWANLNKFKFESAGAASEIQMKRLKDPELRREGVALGVVEWCTNLTHGTRKFEQHEYIYYEGERVVQTPRNRILGAVATYTRDGLREVTETVDLTPGVDE